MNSNAPKGVRFFPINILRAVSSKMMQPWVLYIANILAPLDALDIFDYIEFVSLFDHNSFHNIHSRLFYIIIDN